ncbi:hypothetical protein IKE71_03495 [Candidatus Saccharibacteria bacterium]|nr:hypothetical protein [Candidatus Saccharibacteria bacterium]
MNNDFIIGAATGYCEKASLDNNDITDFVGFLAKVLEEFPKLYAAVDENCLEDFISFAWWAYAGRTSVLEDFFLGTCWPIDGEPRPLVEDSNFARALETDPLAVHTRIKIKDYVKHTNWIFHKTENLPNIFLYGGETVPERLVGLRQCKITRVNPQYRLATNYIFPSRIQQKNIDDIPDSNLPGYEGAQIAKHMKNTINLDQFEATQNVFIIDNHTLTFQEEAMKSLLKRAEFYLTPHGRVLFDIPFISLDALTAHSPIWRLASYRASNSLDRPETINENVFHVIKIVNDFNAAQERRDRALFEVEDIKVTVNNHYFTDPCGLRVYLKKSE